MQKIRVGIAGYGNLGRGVELALRQNPDMELCVVFTRREGLAIATPGVPVAKMADAPDWQGKLDVLILCGGSATDLPQQGPQMARLFHTIDSFDTHAKVPEYFAAMDAALQQAGHVGILSVGWDPGLFSINRLLMGSVLPDGKDYTFWGRGVSQGHSDAIRRVPGVKNAVQYTVPVQEVMERIRGGEMGDYTTREKHTRECFVVLEEGADPKEVERQIVSMPNYFSDYDTTVHFISEEELHRDHGTLPHAGFVIRSGRTGAEKQTKQQLEFSLKLGSNPEFTASVLVAYARAAARLAAKGEKGARTVFDIAPGLLSPLSPEEQRARLL